ncbi:hypothetical protein METBIDRAFT_180992 [Metschnikowia bicuspidata var. bicuspidata NRRL YB-4993]|uniref:Uncharacterized protein n=1 Tax=Metschnikowia bicuspidata var. bicuspidata NRRL YB-4993 TaxID=869754 RepID=A0A1A0HBT2_9ASCO|nr:hypothetical protein METBIDRAFT_180992 [Metschnikowia bicuspidata var. bicuspidata NRRL YB-4993]OBA21348.1 hypothetical protein METBIDRAFT_180992 [Metschnikowia bicuspidata var. bicuspidata NRRL YB-4993]
MGPNGMFDGGLEVPVFSVLKVLVTRAAHQEAIQRNTAPHECTGLSSAQGEPPSDQKNGTGAAETTTRQTPGFEPFFSFLNPPERGRSMAFCWWAVAVACGRKARVAGAVCRRRHPHGLRLCIYFPFFSFYFFALQNFNTYSPSLLQLPVPSARFLCFHLSCFFLSIRSIALTPGLPLSPHRASQVPNQKAELWICPLISKHQHSRVLPQPSFPAQPQAPDLHPFSSPPLLSAAAQRSFFFSFFPDFSPPEAIRTVNEQP